MKYCPECGFERESNFCSKCGYKFIIDTPSNKKTGSAKLVNNSQGNDIRASFSNKKKLYFLNEIPTKPLLKLIKLFDGKNDYTIKNLTHLVFYSIEETSQIGGWDIGFSVAICSNKLYLLISSGEPVRILHKSTTSLKYDMYEIYDFSKKKFLYDFGVEGDYLILKDKENNQFIQHNIENHQNVYVELINYFNNHIQFIHNLEQEGLFIEQDVFIKKDKLTIGQIVEKFLLICFLAFLIFVAVIWVLSKVA
jgi:hypothetical protein